MTEVSLSEADLRNLQRSRGWARFLAVLGFLATVACALGGVAMAVASRTLAVPGGAAIGVGAAAMVVGAIAMGFYGVFTWRYASAVAALQGRQGPALVSAFRNLRYLWTFHVILSGLGLLFTLGSIVATWMGWMPSSAGTGGPPGGG
jgi:hypothetical protein